MANSNSEITPTTDLITPSTATASNAQGTVSVPSVQDTTAAHSAEQPEPEGPRLRRSSRIRNRAAAPVIPQAEESRDDSPVNRLDQIPCSSPAELGLQNDRLGALQIRLHPVAAALINFHAHLTKTEVIGYLGGTFYRPRDRPLEAHVIIVEAFPVKALTDREMSRSGRNSFMEVEINPESSVNAMCYIEAKGLRVVGWYHSHPDPSFTIEPSRVDIQNQLNYQELLFRNLPFVGGIIAPCNRDLPDHASAFEFFAVWSEDIPVRVPYRLDTLATVPSDELPIYWTNGSRQFKLDELRNSCQSLVNDYKQKPRRVRITREWRDGVSFAEKLNRIMTAFGGACREVAATHVSTSLQNGRDETQEGVSNRPNEGSNGAQSAMEAAVEIVGQADLFEECMKEAIKFAEEQYLEVEEREEQQKAERRKRTAANRSKRSRRR